MGLKKLGRYDIVGVLGRGAMGLVYEARDPNLDRRVAIKTIKVDNLSQSGADEYAMRFRTEARSAARLQHPNIVSVYDSDRHHDIAYLVMEFVPGEDLKQHMDSGRSFTLKESLSMMRDLLAALEYAHARHVIHRDVKPANLMVDANGRVKLTDFGVARMQDSGEGTRTRGSMVGTLKYMSPEQVQGQTVDARADLFAAGVVLYQLLTGRRPFDGESEFEIIQQIITTSPPLPSILNPTLPAAFDDVVARALAKSREQRFASAQEFALALREAGGLVQDQTIALPRGASGPFAPIGTGSGSLRSRTGGSTARLARQPDGSLSTVTQELELVYWKDVKDSDDKQDLLGFLDRFPSGIYAALARRRLRKWDDNSVGDHSASGTGTLVWPAAPPALPSDATLLADEHTLMLEREKIVAAPAAATSASRRSDDAVEPAAGSADAGTDEAAPADGGGDQAAVERSSVGAAIGKGTVGGADEGFGVGIEQVAEAGSVAGDGSTPGVRMPAPQLIAPESAASSDESPAQDLAQVHPAWQEQDVAAPERARPRSRTGLVVVAGVALLSIAAAVYMRSGTDSSAQLAAPDTNVVLPVAVPNTVAAAPLAAPANDAPAVVATAPAMAVSGTALATVAVPTPKDKPTPVRFVPTEAAAGKPAVKPAVVQPPAAAALAVPVATQATATAAPSASSGKPGLAKIGASDIAPVVSAPPTSPEAACQGRVLLGYQSCMSEQCAKPMFFDLAICAQRRQSEQARKAQQSNRN